MNTPLQMVGDLLQLSAATPTPRLVIDPLLLFSQGRRTAHENKHTDGSHVLASTSFSHRRPNLLCFPFSVKMLR